MGIEKYYTQTLVPQTWTAAAAWPYQETWADGTSFKGALDTIGGNERWADAQIVAISTHWISCSTSVSITKNQRIKYGARIFEITAIPDPCTLKPGHHQEIYLKEIT